MKNYNNLNEIQIVELFNEKMKDYILDKRTELKSEKFELMDSFKMFVEFKNLILGHPKHIQDATIRDILFLGNINERLELIGLLRNIIEVYLYDFIDKEEILGCYKNRLIEYLNFVKKHLTLADPNSTPIGLDYPFFDFDIDFFVDYVRYYVKKSERITYLNYVLLLLELQDVTYKPNETSYFYNKHHRLNIIIKSLSNKQKEEIKNVLERLVSNYKYDEDYQKRNNNNFLLEDKTNFEFGYIKNGKLFWTEKLNQLAYAIYEIHEKLGLEKITAYSIREEIINSNKIVFKGNLNTIKNYLEKLLSGKQDFHKTVFELPPRNRTLS